MGAAQHCARCGAAVADAHRHTVWHAELDRALGEARLTREDLDYLRDQLKDGEVRVPRGRTGS